LRQGRRGFTLLELVVVAALVVVVGTVMAGAFAAGLRVWERCRSVGRREVDLAVALEQVEKDIRNASPSRFALFRGEAGWIEIPSLVRLERAAKSEEDVGTVRYERGGGGRTLDRVITLRRSSQGSNLTRETLLPSVGDVAFSFGETDGAVVTWNSAWVGRTNLPFAVKVTVALVENGDRCERQRMVILPCR
jgi:prepilin-type N-terminal cleavage/methylation domain-containing protein